MRGQALARHRRSVEAAPAGGLRDDTGGPGRRGPERLPSGSPGLAAAAGQARGWPHTRVLFP